MSFLFSNVRKIRLRYPLGETSSCIFVTLATPLDLSDLGKSNPVWNYLPASRANLKLPSVLRNKI